MPKLHVNTFDHYQLGHSLLHKLDPRIKILITLTFIFSNVLLPDGSWLAFLFAWLLLLFAARIAGLGPRFLIFRSFVALPFAVAAITTIFTLPGEPVLGFQVGSWTLVATDAGLVRFLSILLRSWISIQAAILLTAVTQFPDLVHGMRHLRVPGVLVTIIAFMYRYLYVLIDETLRLLRARESRSARISPGKSGGTIAWRAKIAGNMAGQLFMRSYERSDRVYNAMLARGYRGHLLTMTPHIIEKKDWVFGGIAFLLIVFIQLSGRLF